MCLCRLCAVVSEIRVSNILDLCRLCAVVSETRVSNRCFGSVLLLSCQRKLSRTVGIIFCCSLNKGNYFGWPDIIVTHGCCYLSMKVTYKIEDTDSSS